MQKLLVASLLSLSGAARLSRQTGGKQGKAAHRSEAAKHIAGVPVYNYDNYEARTATPDGFSWVVIMNAGTTNAQIEKACQNADGGCKFVGHPDEGGVPFLEFRGSESALAQVLKASEGAAMFVEPGMEARIIPEVEAEPTASTWGLNRIGADKRGNYGEGVHIYVFDTGVRVTHTEFTGRAVPTLDLSNDRVEECHGDLSCAADRQGHGTHCAGTAGGQNYGVASEASVHGVKVLSDAGPGSWSWSISALDWVGFKGERPAVVSMSLGGSGNVVSVESAVDAAVNAGVTVVVAAGNENQDACGFSPAYVPSAITVGSTSSNDRRSPFSNFGTCTDIWAPGSRVRSASNADDTSAISFSGTSMACPHVSGAAALILELNPSMEPRDLKRRLRDSSISGAISGLKSSDTNSLLYVGADAATPPPFDPEACPRWTSTGPDRQGDCKCNTGFTCLENGEVGCTFSSTGGNGINDYPRSNTYFLKSCEGCECKEM